LIEVQEVKAKLHCRLESAGNKLIKPPSVKSQLNSINSQSSTYVKYLNFQAITTQGGTQPTGEACHLAAWDTKKLSLLQLRYVCLYVYEYVCLWMNEYVWMKFK
jgi:hypothetical protein